MKKFILILMIVSLFFVTACSGRKEENTKDEKKFKEEYESLNGKKQGEKVIMSIDVSEDNKMKYIDSSEVVRILEGKTGVVYFGFPNCPWCRNIVPVLIDALHDTGLDHVYYANLLEERDTKKIDEEGKIVVEKEGSKNYQRILELLHDQLGNYEGLNDDSIKRLYFPTVVFVKNGKVEDIHIGSLDSQKDPYKKLTKKQYEELKTIYEKGITKIQNLTCDTDKTC